MKHLISITVLLLMVANLFLFRYNYKVDKGIDEYLYLDEGDSTFQILFDNILDQQMYRRRSRSEKLLPTIQYVLQYIEEQNVESFTTKEQFDKLKYIIESTFNISLESPFLSYSKRLITHDVFNSKRLNKHYKKSLKRMIISTLAMAQPCNMFFPRYELKVLKDHIHNCDKAILSTTHLDGYYYDLSIADTDYITRGYMELSIANENIINNRVPVKMYSSWRKKDSVTYDLKLF